MSNHFFFWIKILWKLIISLSYVNRDNNLLGQLGNVLELLFRYLLFKLPSIFLTTKKCLLIYLITLGRADFGCLVQNTLGHFDAG